MKFLITGLILGMAACKAKQDGSHHEPAGLPDDREQIMRGNECELQFAFLLEFEAGKRPEVKYKWYNASGQELPTLLTVVRPQAWKRLEADAWKITFHEVHVVSVLGGPGNYRVEALIDGKKPTGAEQFVSHNQDGCPRFPDKGLNVPSLAPLVMEENREYFPLESGDIIDVEKSSGVAQSLTSGKKYVEVEIVRELRKINEGSIISARLLEKHATPEPVLKLEKDMEGSGKISLGKFHERGIERGAVTDPEFEDNLVRQVFAREQVPAPLELK